MFEQQEKKERRQGEEKEKGDRREEEEGEKANLSTPPSFHTPILVSEILWY